MHFLNDLHPAGLLTAFRPNRNNRGPVRAAGPRRSPDEIRRLLLTLLPSLI